MKNVILALVVFAGIALLFLILNPMMGGLESFRTDEQVDTFSSTTAGGETTENLTLTQSLFQDDTHYASVSSNYTDDVPLATAYNAGTQVLTISGLVASQTRALAITYEFGSLDSSVDTVAGLVPTLWIVSIIAIIGLAIAVVVLGLRRG